MSRHRSLARSRRLGVIGPAASASACEAEAVSFRAVFNVLRELSRIFGDEFRPPGASTAQFDEWRHQVASMSAPQRKLALRRAMRPGVRAPQCADDFARLALLERADEELAAARGKLRTGRVIPR